jgi:tetratricopeptide (TPR) repeat protein
VEPAAEDGTRVSALTPEAPWPGPAPYTEDDRRFFHGRKAETAELHRLVRAEPLCLLFGVSGLGKTSLLRAGLFPRLLEDGWLPILIRLEHADGAPSYARQVLDQAERAARDASVTPPPWPKDRRDGVDAPVLVQAIHGSGRFWGAGPDPVTPVLVFDQFEEAFTQTRDRPAARERVEKFLADLAALLEPGVPNPAPLRIVLSLREDHLATLESLRHLLPAVRHARLRLLPFTAAQAREVVLVPGEHLVDTDAADAIVETFVLPGGDPERTAAEPVLLSLFCWQLNQSRAARARITRTQVETSRGEFLRRFYEDAFQGLQPAEADAVRKFVEDELVDDAGYRTSAGLEHAVRQPGVTRAALDHLIQKRLLHVIDRAGGLTHLELIHDRFAEEARQSRETRRAAEATALLERQQQEAAEREEKLRAQVRQQRLVIVAAFVGSLIMLALAGWALRERWNAAAARTRAEELATKALDARKAADELIAFMQYDLRDSLGKLGRLSMMEDINERIRRYHEQHPPEGDDTSALRERSVALEQQGDILAAQGKLAEALAAYQADLAIAQRLADLDSDNTEWQRDLSISHNKVGDILRSQGKLADALAAYQQALAIRQRLAALDPQNAEGQRDLSVSHNKLGDILTTQGRLADALAAYQAALGIAQRLAALDLDNTEWQRDLSVSHNKVAEILVEQGKLADALAAQEQALAIRQRLVALDPNNAQWQRDLSVSHERIGGTLTAQGKLADALAAYQQELAIVQRLAALDPENTDWQRGLSISHSKVAETLRRQGKLADALSANQQALAIRQRLAALDPDNAEWQRDLSVSLYNLGGILTAQGKLAEALSAFQQDLAIAQRLAAIDPDNAEWQIDVAKSYGTTAQALKAQKDASLPEVESLLRKGIEVLDRLIDEGVELDDTRDTRAWLVKLLGRED